MKTMAYKGFIGSVEYDEEDKYFWGKVLNVDEKVFIQFEGDTIEELEKDFEEAIDFHLLDEMMVEMPKETTPKER